MATTIQGDAWRIKHDTMKSEPNRLCVWSSLPVTCEVFGLFSQLIPQEGLSRIERGGEAGHGSCPRGGKVSKLAELKGINCCPTCYTPGDRDKVVDKKAKLLHGEYKKKARDADRKFGGTAEGIIGPVESKLLQYGDLQGLLVGESSPYHQTRVPLFHISRGFVLVIM